MVYRLVIISKGSKGYMPSKTRQLLANRPFLALQRTTADILGHDSLVLWNKHLQAHPVAEKRREHPGFTPTALSNGQNPTPPVVREMGLQIEPVDGRWGSE
jgi:hypothetical protein